METPVMKSSLNWFEAVPTRSAAIFQCSDEKVSDKLTGISWNTDRFSSILQGKELQYILHIALICTFPRFM